MKFKNFLMGGMIATLAAFFIVGCNENPDDPGNGDGDEVEAVTNLKAVSLSATSVGLSWNASTTTGATYKVEWMNGTTSVGTADVSGTSTTVNGLIEGTAYAFTVVAVDADDNESDPVSVTWAPAARFTSDQEKGGVIRIYERDAPSANQGTGLVLDPNLDGPRNVSVAGSLGTNPDLANIHLVADVQSNEITIGPGKATAFDDFTNYSLFPNNVQVSDNYVVTTGLDNWHMSGTLNDLFSTNNKEAFVIQNQQANNQGVGFAVRMGTGVSGQFRYARIFVVPGADGKLVQNDGFDYVVLHVSFQTVTGVPYAKGN